MRKLILSLAATPLILGSMAVSANAADDGLNILDNLSFKGEIRPRYEYADIADNGKDAANAFTVRTALGIQSKKTFGLDWLGAYLEATSVNNFGWTDYAPAATGTKGPYDTILDAQQARMTQAYLDFKIGDKNLIRAGRQLMNVDNQRYIGAVGWRQMSQTFDAVAVVSNPIEDLSITAAYIYGIMTVAPQNIAHDTSSVALNASYKIADPIKVTGYAYLLSNVRTDGGVNAYNGSDTYGVAATGKIAASDSIKLDYRAEVAIQTDPTLKYGTIADQGQMDALYYNVDVGANFSGILAGINYESLGAADDLVNDRDGFHTPLATLHKFQGWADVFLGRTNGGGGNKAGLTDANGRVGYKSKSFGKALVVFHKFDAIEGTLTDLGTEIDVLYTRAIPGVNGLNGLLKGAVYSAGDQGIGADLDKTVVWAQLDYKFSL